MRHLIVCVLALALGSPAPAFESGRQSLQVDGQTRNYLVRAELIRARTQRVPLVLVLHGGGGNAANAENMTGFTRKAREQGFIVVYPEGSGPLEDKLLTWNAGHCCAYAMKNGIDDVRFIDALLDELLRRYPVDPARIYATGMSNGGMMTHRLGRELPRRFAAIAPVVATLFGDERKPARPVPALMINGLEDVNVPWQGGPPGGRGARSWDGTPALPAVAQGEFWAAANGCGPAPRKHDEARWILWSWSCPAANPVELYLLKDNGHAWPGGQPGSRRGDTPSTSMNATDVIWGFFRAHSRQPE
jgi:polyhydroxybutyrate depolymerase